MSRWCSNRHASNAASNLIFLADILPDSDERKEECAKFCKGQINYNLGDNPLHINYVVGAEENSPKSEHHRQLPSLMIEMVNQLKKLILYGVL